MDLIYIIIAHKNPDQLKKLILALNTENSYFYIHIDSKVNLREFLFESRVDNVYYLENRLDCFWGDFSIVEATILLIKKVLENHENGFCCLLSGLDYPVKPKQYIESYLAWNSDYNFIEIKPIHEKWSKNELSSRTESYRITRRNKALYFKGVNRRTLRLLITGELPVYFLPLLFKKRKAPLPLYGGSQWWRLNLKTLRKMIVYINSNYTKLSGYFKYTNCADEIFFHSILKLLSNTDSSIKIEPTLTYTDWAKGDGFSPFTFTSNEFEELILNTKRELFARKFDMNIDMEVFSLLGEHLRGKIDD